MIPLSKVRTFLVQNYIISILVAVLIFVGFVVVYKMVTQKNEVVYAQIKVSQGMWWVNTAKPGSWMLQAIQKGDVERNVVGKSIAEVIEVRSYPWWGSEQFDIYITVKLSVDKNNRTGKYAYNRSSIAVGAPITFDLDKITVSGTIIALSDKPLERSLKPKIITLQKAFAEDWEYEAIAIGDSYNDGVDTVFEVLDKNYSDATSVYSNLGRKEVLSTANPITIKVNVKILVDEINGTFLFREMPIKLGRTLNIQTSTYIFENYFITEIE